MSVLVKDMRFPNYCSDCEFSKPWGNDATYCSRYPEKECIEYGEEKPDWCPIFDVPDDGVVVSKAEFKIYSRALLTALTLRDLMINLHTFDPTSIQIRG